MSKITIPVIVIPKMTGDVFRPFIKLQASHIGGELLKFLKNELKLVVDEEREQYCNEIDKNEDDLLKLKVMNDEHGIKFGRYFSIYQKVFDQVPNTNISFNWGIVQKSPNFYIFAFGVYVLTKMSNFLHEAQCETMDDVKTICRTIMVANQIAQKISEIFQESFSPIATLDELNRFTTLLEAWNAHAGVFIAVIRKMKYEKIAKVKTSKFR